ncbi:MAG: ISL3 family transposase [Deltaproteobacteria bacterium]|nr:ISL3 family transposase [Deltaproteobacteria bacterium]
MVQDLKQFYARLLKLERPWIVKEVRFEESPERVDVYVDHEHGIKLRCPRCDAWCPVYDHLPEREWQHLDTCAVATYVHTRLPRVKCKEHGVISIGAQWAEPGSDLTMALEARLIDLEKECSIQAVSRLTGLSWDRCGGVLTRAVRRGQERKAWKVPQYLGVDEKSFAKRHQYLTLVCDLDTRTVEYVADDRRQESLEGYFLPFADAELEQIQAICMDMHDPYIAAVRTRVPQGMDKIVFDKFHVLRLMNEAVDKVRRQEHKDLQAQKDEVLKGTKYLWLYRQDHIPEHLLPRFEELRRMDLQVSRAWAIKETLRNLWNYRRQGWARRFFQRWYFWATHSRLPPVIAVAHTLQNRLDNVLTYLPHRITNALSEALNAQIETVKRMASGYRNREHFHTAIYFHCGGLDLYPRPQPVGATHTRSG